MKHLLLRYGLISAGILLGINLLILLILGIPEPDDYALGEVIGYATIVLAMVPVYFGIQYYRDVLSGGTISFWRAVGVGLAVATMPSIAFALYNLFHVKVIDPDFPEKYMQHTLDAAREEMTTAEFEQYAAGVEAQSAVFTDPLVGSIVMFLTVFAVGFVAAIVSGIILRRRAPAVS